MKCWSVYKHVCPDGKVYIGATSRPPKVRWNYGYGYRNSVFYTAVLKYGWNAILHEVISSDLNEEQAYDLEKKLIRDYNSTDPQRGYNVAAGGKGSTGVIISDKTRSRLVSSHLGKKNPHTPEWNKKIGDSQRAIKKPHDGVPRDAACRAKISKALSKPVKQYDENQVLINVFPSVRVASRETGVRNQYISNCCLGKTKSAGGYVWKY